MDCPVLDRLRPPRVSCASPFRWHSSCSLFQVRKPGIVGSVVGRFIPCHCLIILPTIMVQWRMHSTIESFLSGKVPLYLLAFWWRFQYFWLFCPSWCWSAVRRAPSWSLGSAMKNHEQQGVSCRIQHPEPQTFQIPDSWCLEVSQGAPLFGTRHVFGFYALSKITSICWTKTCSQFQVKFSLYWYEPHQFSYALTEVYFISSMIAFLLLVSNN